VISVMIRGVVYFYFSAIPHRIFERSYRRLAVMGIFIYQVFLRKIVNRPCNFKIGCSQFTADMLNSNRSFNDVRDACLNRYCNCSSSLNWVSSGTHIRFFTANGEEIPCDEVSIKIIQKACVETGALQSIR
jgi:putative component of membrane protein insertase Oxa1/YidC/SpoIIIJ protein YidD